MSTLTSTALNRLATLDEVKNLVLSGAPLSLAGRETALAQLPAGNWIGGTIPYFMLPEGGTLVDDTKLFITDFSGLGDVTVAAYSPDELQHVSGKAPENSLGVVIIPAFSEAHERFAREAASYPGTFLNPTAGWISGVDLNEEGATPKVFDGRTATALTNHAVVSYITLPEDKLASLQIINPFQPGTGDELHFATTSFEVTDVLVNGTPTRFLDYLKAHELDNGLLPLVGDFSGAHINVSIKSVDPETGAVQLYAPVFPGVTYRFAEPIGDYAETFRNLLHGKTNNDDTLWSCNCILNYLFGELEGKAIGGVAGPITFGEIAYQLLNQTLVQARIV